MMAKVDYRAGAAIKWDEMPWEEVRPGVRRCGFGNNEVTLVMNEILPRIEPRPHRHHGFFQIATIVRGHALYHVGDIHNEVGPGSVIMIPAGVEHYIENIGSEPVLNLDIFAPARPDYAHLIGWMKG